MNKIVKLSTCCIVLGASTAAYADLTPISPFAGAYSEGFESFPARDSASPPPYPNWTAGPLSIMGGVATISTKSLLPTEQEKFVIYNTTDSKFGLAADYANVAEGYQGLGINNLSAKTTIDFTQPINEFGAYWGAANGFGYSGLIDFAFSDGSTATYTYSHPNDGNLDWLGWASDKPITSVSYIGAYVAVDAIQANPVPPPPPPPSNVPDAASTLSLLGLAMTGMAALRARRER
jgi:hypothetical protein